MGSIAHNFGGIKPLFEIKAMQAEWLNEIKKRAAEFWTPERQAHLLGGRRLLLHPVDDAPLWRAMGLMQAHGEMTPESMRKFWQISQMVRLILPDLQALNQKYAQPVIIDCGCGRSYLSLLLAWYYRHYLKHDAQIIGLDFNEPVIKQCQRRAAQLELSELITFKCQKLEEAEIPQKINVLLALHACNTATDWALFYGIKNKADFIAAAPCCQAELAAFWEKKALEKASGPLAVFMNTPHLRRQSAATFTDALRLLLLRINGYKSTAIEFVPEENSPKNTLIKASFNGELDLEAEMQFKSLRELAGSPCLTLEKLLLQAEMNV